MINIRIRKWNLRKNEALPVQLLNITSKEYHFKIILFQKITNSISEVAILLLKVLQNI